MSNAEVEQFYQQVVQDASLQERFRAAIAPEAVLALAVELGQAEGFHFTEVEVREWLDAQVNCTTELPEADLDQISGGNPLTYSPLVNLPPVI